MNIWLVTIGEPLPLEGKRDRLFRTGLLSNILTSRGHTVHWFSSTFDHSRREQLFDGDRELRLNHLLTVTLIHAPPYQNSISIKRLLSHSILGARFKRSICNRPPPDIILCSYPTIELSYESVAFGVQHRVPVILDIRDLWPDIFVELLPRAIRLLGHIGLTPLSLKATTAFKGATGILGLTEPFLEWGLRKANRKPSEFDRVFPMGYSRCTLSRTETQEAESFWDSLNVKDGSDEFTLAYLGTFGPYCQLEVLLQAASQLASAERKIRFVLCGTGRKLDKYRALARHLSNVTLPGWVDRSKVEVLLRRSSAGLVIYAPSINYLLNMPNKPIEYLSAGLPIISSLESGCLAELLHSERCGITYQSSSAEQLASILSNLFDNPDRRAQMSANAENLFHERFEAERVYGEMTDYLQSIVNLHQQVATA